MCPHCGASTASTGGACAACGRRLGPGTLAPAATLTPRPEDGETRLSAPTPVPPGGEAAGPLNIGEPFGTRYRILRVLGAGGMGVVYHAWDEALGVAVALKVIRPEVMADPTTAREVEKRFKRELLLARQVTHRNVVRIHDLGELNGIKYLTMPFVEGQDLARIIRESGRLPVARALAIAREIAAGLTAAHEAGVVHRDLKPENIMVDGEQHAEIMDFGISRSSRAAALAARPRAHGGFSAGLDDANVMAGMTMAGAVVGTVQYMAPEQARGGEVDHRADIYAFGLIFRDMLVGSRQHAGQSALDEMMARIQAAPAGPREVDEQIPETLDRIIRRCLEPDPAARYQSTQELVADLDRLDDEANLLPEPKRITRRLVIGSLAAVIALLAGTWWLAKTRIPPAAPEAVSVLVADFDNRTGDPVFQGSLEQALTIAVEGAGFITTYPRRDALQIAARLPGSSGRIDERAARLVSTREGIKYILAGAIEPSGSGFSIQVRAIDPADGAVVKSASRAADNKQEVLAAVGKLASDVREALGDTTSKSEMLAAAETFTASSLEAMNAYARGQELNYAGRQTDALKAFDEAVRLDPGLARAYAGMGVIYGALKQDAKVEESYQKALKNLDRMSDREKFRTLGGYFLLVTNNYEGAIENYEKLVSQFPADNTGHANLAFAYLKVRNVQRAVEEGRKAIEIYPKNMLQRTNYAMYAMYAGDFKTAIEHSDIVLKENPAFEYPIFTVAGSTLMAGDLEGARRTLARLKAASPLGVSMAAMGEADLQMYLGRPAQAIRLLEPAIEADLAAGNTGDAAAKYVALAEARLATRDRRRAAAAARRAVELRRHESVIYPAARVLIALKDYQGARALADRLDAMLQSQTISYARLIAAEVSLAQHRLSETLDLIADARKRHNSWFARLLLGRMYLEAGRFPEAAAEFETCVKSSGETTDVFFENVSTARYLPPVYYWLGRAQEALGATAAARPSFEQFLKLRSEAEPPDPLAADARDRLTR